MCIRDSNVSDAITRLHELAAEANKDSSKRGTFVSSARLLGLLAPSMGDWASDTSQSPEIVALVSDLLKVWTGLRDKKDYTSADAMKKDMEAL